MSQPAGPACSGAVTCPVLLSPPASRPRYAGAQLAEQLVLAEELFLRHKCAWCLAKGCECHLGHPAAVEPSGSGEANRTSLTWAGGTETFRGLVKGTHGSLFPQGCGILVAAEAGRFVVVLLQTLTDYLELPLPANPISFASLEEQCAAGNKSW